MTKIEPKFDASGVLRSPDLHDGLLRGIIVSKDKQADLIVYDTGGKEYLISLRNVKRLRAKDFFEGNILFDITLFRLESCPMNLLEDLYGIANKFGDSTFIETLKQTEGLEGYHVIDVSPSYGCSLVALFSELEISSA